MKTTKIIGCIFILLLGFGSITSIAKNNPTSKENSPKLKKSCQPGITDANLLSYHTTPYTLPYDKQQIFQYAFDAFVKFQSKHCTNNLSKNSCTEGSNSFVQAFISNKGAMYRAMMNLCVKDDKSFTSNTFCIWK